MTTTQIQEARRNLNRLNSSDTARLRDELWCRDMINSILAYYDETDLEPESYIYTTYLDRFERKLGTVRLGELIREQLADFRSATLLRGVCVDEDGTVYNSIVW